MFTIAPVYVVAAIAGAVESEQRGAWPAGTARGLTGCDVVESFEREVHARSEASTLSAEDAESLLAGAAVLRASLCASRLDQPAARAA
jgi:hypothetical protein